MDMNKVSNKLPELSEFPPKLRKLGLFIINSGQLMTLKEASEATGISYSTIRTQIMRCKKKGNDFNKLVHTHVIEKLRNARPDVYKSLQERAIEGLATHTRLFAQLTGDLIERQEHKHAHAVIVTSPMSTQPPAGIVRKELEYQKKEKEKIIDIEVIK